MSGRVVQGWQPDPFGLHEARYFSAAGEPTKLVRDRGAGSAVPSQVTTPPAASPAASGGSLQP